MSVVHDKVAVLGGESPAVLGDDVVLGSAVSGSMSRLESSLCSPQINSDLKDVLDDDALKQISIIKEITAEIESVIEKKAPKPRQIEGIQDAWQALKDNVENSSSISNKHEPALNLYRAEVEEFISLANNAASKRNWEWATKRIDHLLDQYGQKLDGYNDNKSVAEKIDFARSLLDSDSIDNKEINTLLKTELIKLAGYMEQIEDMPALKLPEISIPDKQVASERTEPVAHLLEGTHYLRTSNALDMQVSLVVKDGALELAITREIKSSPGNFARLRGATPEVLGQSVVRLQLEDMVPVTKSQAAEALEQLDKRLDEIYQRIAAADQPAIKTENGQAVLNTDNYALLEYLKGGRVTELSNITIKNDELMGLDCRDSRLTNVLFNNSNLAGLRGAGATIEDCTFERCFAPGMVFNEDTRFTGHNKIIGSDISYTELAGSHENTFITGCNLYGVEEDRQAQWKVSLDSTTKKPSTFSYSDLHSALYSANLLEAAAGLYGVKHSPDLILLNGKNPDQLIRVLQSGAGAEISELMLNDKYRVQENAEPAQKPQDNTLALLKAISLARFEERSKPAAQEGKTSELRAA